jgi:hypothetical protein
VSHERVRSPELRFDLPMVRPPGAAKIHQSSPMPQEFTHFSEDAEPAAQERR